LGKGTVYLRIDLIGERDGYRGVSLGLCSAVGSREGSCGFRDHLNPLSRGWPGLNMSRNPSLVRPELGLDG